MYHNCMACSLENMVICLEDIKSGRCLKGVPNGDYNFRSKMYLDYNSVFYFIHFVSCISKPP